jgi:Chaperone of endosialidase
MAVPYTFATATSSIPLSELDTNFATAITLGNTAVYLGNTTTSIGNLTLTNTTISSVAATFPNSFLANSSVTLGTTSVSLGGTATTLANLTLSNVTISSGTSTATQNLANVTGTLAVGNGGTGLTSFTSGGVVYASSTSALATGSTFVFDGTNVGIGLTPNSNQGKLQINQTLGGTINGAIRITDNATTSLVLNNTSSGVSGIWSSGVFTFGTGNNTNSEKMRIDTSGNVGIGTSSPSYQLDIVNATTSPLLRIAYNGTYYSTIDYQGSINTVTTASTDLWQLKRNGTTQVSLDGSGNLGLGVTPSAWNLFKAVQIGNGSFVSYSTNNTVMYSNAYYASGGNTYISTGTATQYQQNNGAHIWYNAPSGTAGNTISFTQAMTLDNSGNLLVGTTATNVTSGGYNFLLNSGSSYQTIGHATGSASGGAYIAFRYNNGDIGTITQSGTTAVLYNTTSDQRLKTNIVDAPQGNIDQIKVRSFDWIADGSHQEYGMVAQELLEVAPYAVSQPTNPDEMMGVDYSKLVPMMIKEIQDLKQRILTLENK